MYSFNSLFVFTVRNSSGGRVMFSQACVKNSVHRGKAGRHPPKQTPRADTLTDGHCSGRYASYWNAFLFFNLSSALGSIHSTIKSHRFSYCLTLSAAWWTYVDCCLNRQSGLNGPILLTRKVD